MELPKRGTPREEVIANIRSRKQGDADWRGGKTWSLIYPAGDDVDEVLREANELYLYENALNPFRFPSLRQMEVDVVEMTGHMLHAPDGFGGAMSSGGTESILLGVLTARERAKAERGVTRPEMVAPYSAHPAFAKAAKVLGIELHQVPLDDACRARVDEAEALINENTVLVVGSAPQYPQGVIDDIQAIAALAADGGFSCHVDACMGGFVLPFAEMLGREVPPWDFRVDGVTTISADVHKLGYAPKGVSVILHRTRELRRYQTFVFDDWLGGFYASPNLQGSRSGLPMAAAWAVMQHLGVDGYVDLTRTVLENADRMRAGIEDVDGIRVLGDPRFHLLAIAADPEADEPIDVFALGDELATDGWFHDRQGPPDSLHATVSNSNSGVIDDYVGAIGRAVAKIRGSEADDRSTSYSTID